MDHRLDSQHDRDIWKFIQAFDASRDEQSQGQHDLSQKTIPIDTKLQLLAKKYRKMRKNTLAFFRGSCHLFYRDLPVDSSLNLAPVGWICGDLHVENFGTYKGDDRQIYFGINDFDEGILAPCTWDIARLLTSIFLAADNLSRDKLAGQQLAKICLHSYANTLSIGRVQAIVEDNSSGIVADLLDNLRHRNRSELLNDRTKLIQDRRQLKFDNKKILKIDRQLQERVTQSIDLWAQTQANRDFFEVLDVGFRVAGTGSLGRDRYLILVAGKGSPDRNYLLDLKQQSTSALQPYSIVEQPPWDNPATRVLKVQQLAQSAPPALLAAIEFNGSSYLLRELQPTQDKITLKPHKISVAQLEKLIDTMAKATAYAHLHSSGKSGAATAPDLINFGNNLDWQQEVLTYANNYAKQVRSDYQDFCKASQDL